MKKIKIADKSGDKEFFTIIPNYVLNHSTIYDREVYIQMKRIAGEDGSCFMSQRKLAKQCGLSINRVRKSIEYLVDHRWIFLRGKKEVAGRGGKQFVLEYEVANLWQLNSEFYKNKTNAKGVSPDDTPTAKGVSPDDTKVYHENAKGVSPGADEEDPVKNIHIEEDPNVGEPASEPVAGQEVKEIKPDLNNDFFPLFEPLNPTYERLFANRAERAALERLIKKFGPEGVKSMIERLPKIVSMPFAPKVTKPTELERELGKIKQFLAQEKSKAEKKGLKVFVGK
ncbi:MAG: helix-turn-helix domain-containing protein [Patescibacteria group bacterium]|nr:helix-turn-helix domain-containing protein [Patescibacteria group bacterium]MDE2233070.1 helix-turn-helix domain-containing protein [Patescibacteria group bacterium]